MLPRVEWTSRVITVCIPLLGFDELREGPWRSSMVVPLMPKLVPCLMARVALPPVPAKLCLDEVVSTKLQSLAWGLAELVAACREFYAEKHPQLEGLLDAERQHVQALSMRALDLVASQATQNSKTMVRLGGELVEQMEKADDVEAIMAISKTTDAKALKDMFETARHEAAVLQDMQSKLTPALHALMIAKPFEARLQKALEGVETENHSVTTAVTSFVTVHCLMKPVKVGGSRNAMLQVATRFIGEHGKPVPRLGMLLDQALTAATAD